RGSRDTEPWVARVVCDAPDVVFGRTAVGIALPPGVVRHRTCRRVGYCVGVRGVELRAADRELVEVVPLVRRIAVERLVALRRSQPQYRTCGGRRGARVRF